MIYLLFFDPYIENILKKRSRTAIIPRNDPENNSVFVIEAHQAVPALHPSIFGAMLSVFSYMFRLCDGSCAKTRLLERVLARSETRSQMPPLA